MFCLNVSFIIIIIEYPRTVLYSRAKAKTLTQLRCAILTNFYEILFKQLAHTIFDRNTISKIKF